MSKAEESRDADEREHLTTVALPPGADEAPADAWLVVVVGGSSRRHSLPAAGEVTIGRGEGCAVIIDDPSISRRHALLRVGEPFTVEDLGSRNGTHVRGAPVPPREPVPVVAGEVMDIGAAMVILQRRTAAPLPHRLWDHGYFEGRLEEECARAERARGQLALLRVRCEPPEAPAVIAGAIAEELRPDDVLGAYGPGEVEVLLPATPPADAEGRARALERRLRRAGIEGRAGVACYPRDGQSAGVLAALAGRAGRGAAVEVGDEGGVLLTSSEAMERVYRLAERIAASPLSVLILGETGVGKEVMAEAIHRLSPRRAKPFLKLNCAALSGSLLESELFGHERGAFTGAAQAKAGLLETADGGSVLLDEVGDMPLEVQVKLLRVIEEREVLRVGALKPRPIDVRFLAATHRDLEEEIGAGRFRQDLYFRLNGVALTIPPLRERSAEIAGLARLFAERAAAQSGVPVPAIAPETLAQLQRYTWPGNIRELRNAIDRAVVLCAGGCIRPEDLPLEKMRSVLAAPPPRALAAPAAAPAPTASKASGSSSEPDTDASFGAPGAGLRDEIERYERQRILDALERCGGNQTKAAKMLGIARRTLLNRLDAYGIPRPRKRARRDEG